MELSAKDKILLAMYTEYQKDIPDMDSVVTMKNLCLNKEEFYIGIEKLLNEHLINGGGYSRGNKNRIITAFLNDAMPSVYGLRYVEEKLLLDTNNNAEEEDPRTGNIKKVIRNAITFGWGEIKDIAAKTLAEISKNQ